jgi:hypothetical protein
MHDHFRLRPTAAIEPHEYHPEMLIGRNIIDIIY